MKPVICKVILVIIAITALAAVNTPIVNAQDDLQAASEIIKKQKKLYIEKMMELTPQEKGAFWSLYAKYESELSKLRGKRIELATHFLQSHGNISNAEAIAMLKQKLRLDFDDIRFKQTYIAKFMQVLPGRKVVRFYQAENRFDTAATAELYRNIPVIR
jgi:ribosome-binding ATPase YchF (GTP1/OBG family)